MVRGRVRNVTERASKRPAVRVFLKGPLSEQVVGKVITVVVRLIHSDSEALLRLVSLLQQLLSGPIAQQQNLTTDPVIEVGQQQRTGLHTSRIVSKERSG
jgi:hypothetical protein